MVTVCLKEEVAESLMEDLVKTDLARLLQVLDHHGSHARIRQYDLLASSEHYRYQVIKYLKNAAPCRAQMHTGTGIYRTIRTHNKYIIV